MSELKRITKNSVYNFLSIIVTKAITLIVIILLARYLGAEKYGQLSFAISFAGLFAIFGDFGISLLLKRLVAREKTRVNYYFVNATILKCLMNIGTFALIALTAFVLNYERNTYTLLLLGGLFVILSNLNPAKSVFDAFERMKYTFYLKATKFITRFLLILLIIFTQRGVIEILIAYGLVELLMSISEIILYHKKIHPLSWDVDIKLWRNLTKRALPFGIAALFMTVYDKVDVTMLSKMVANPDLIIGWYNSAYELMSSLAFIPGALTGAIAPIAYRAYLDNIEKLKKIYTTTFRLFMTVGVPICIGTTLLADKVIDLIYGADYTGSVIALQILIWSIIFNFEMFALGLALNSMNLEKITMQATIVSVIFNISANFILIPRYSYVGAAITTVLSVLIYFTYCFAVVQKRLVKIRLLSYVPMLGASVAMGVAVYFAKPLLAIWFLIPLAGVLYFVLLFLFKGIDNQMITFIKQLVK